MASSLTSEPSIKQETLGSVAADVLQKELPNAGRSLQPSELNATTTNGNDIDNMVVSGNADKSAGATTNSNFVLSKICATIDSCIEALTDTRKNLSSVSVSVNTPTTTDAGDTVDGDSNVVPSSPSSIGEAQACTTITDNRPVQRSSKRHIMISYHHKTASAVCKKICARLLSENYAVWMDTNDMIVRIYEEMAKAIENSDIVLICYNQGYKDSSYCEREALYTDKIGINFIPCRMDKSYHPDGWLAITLADHLYVDFSSPDDFDKSFDELIRKIKHIQNKLQESPACIATACPNDNTLSTAATDTHVDTRALRERFDLIIREYKESINKHDRDLHSLNKDELSHLIILLRDKLFSDASSVPGTENNVNSQRLLQELFMRSQNQNDLLTKITDILPSLTDFKTVIKLFLAFMFIWTVKTHIFDAYMKHT